MAENQTNKERLDAVNVKLDNIISSLQEKTGVVQHTTLKSVLDYTKSTYYLFFGGNVESVDGLIAFEDTENVTNMISMFSHAAIKTIPVFDTSNVTDMSSMFSQCGRLISLPVLNTSKVVTMQNMLNSCINLEEMPAWDVGNVTNFSGMFSQCIKLTKIHMYGMRSNFTIAIYLVTFTRDTLVEILNNLATVTSSRTLSMGSTNLAKLTEDDIAIATAKGWTLS